MNIHIQLIAETPNSSLSVATIEGRFVGFVLEDGYKERKVMHETRIPPGKYNVLQRKEGRFFASYRQQHGHQWVPWLENVPGFEFILIHIGNRISDTSGCLLIGYGAAFYRADDLWTISNSTAAYLDLYRRMQSAFEKGEAVTVSISRELQMFPAGPSEEE